ncbi:DHH family phosphoesterase [Methanobrevibacter acididurans]|uniref:DHH family phosphoesterase n=1 Tax=Methanobrevibacter acididurans TaxID=120963 RepID=UPI0038FCCC4F
MKKSCPNCKGNGHITVDTKTCPDCDGTGYADTINMKNHFKGINEKAKKHFDLEATEEIPCEQCHGKGIINVYEECKQCHGTGEINVCKTCGKEIDDKYEYCRDCHMKNKEDKMKNENKKEEKGKYKQIVWVLDQLCGMSDLELENVYKGKVTRVEKYGVFVSLNNQVWGLMRTGNPKQKVGDSIFVRIIQIKERKHEVDMAPARLDNYELKTLKKDIKRTQIGSLTEDNLKSVVKLQAQVIQIQQTSGPTIFTITDETGITWAAAFDEAGVRAYPEIEIEDLVEIIGEVNTHSGKIQIESQSIEKLDPNDAESLKELIDKALDERAQPEDVDFLIESPTLDKLKPKMYEAAKAIRRAILDGRTILIRHHNDADGICSGVAMEKAVVPILKEINPDNEAEYHYFKRSPSKAPFYELEDVVKDLSFALEDLDRHGQKLPLIVLLDNGSTEEDIVALMQAKIYDIEIVVIDHHFPGEVVDGRVAVDDYVDTHVNPYLVGGDSQITAGALATEVAHIINPECKDLISHLPGIAAVGDHAESKEAEDYIKLAGEKDYDREQLDKVAECIDFESYFLRFMNGRGIMDTILGVDNIDKHDKMINALYKEYRRRVDNQLKAAIPNLKKSKLDNGIYFNVLDVEKYAHKFTFPAPGKTCGFVHDSVVQSIGEDKPIVTLAYGPDFGVIRATDAVNEMFGFNLNDVIPKIAVKVPQSGLDGGGHECAGSLKFVEGLSEDVLSTFADEVKALTKKE